MKIQDIIDDLNIDEDQGNKLLSVKHLKEYTGIGLKESKDTVDLFFKYGKHSIEDHTFGKEVINFLKSHKYFPLSGREINWNEIKLNIRKFKL